MRAKLIKAEKSPNEYTRARPFDFAQTKLGYDLPSFFHSGDVLRVVVSAVTVQRRANSQEKLECVTDTVAVIAIEAVGAIVDGELGTETYVNTFTVRQVADVTERYPLTGKISDSSASSRTSSCPDFWTRSQRK